MSLNSGYWLARGDRRGHVAVDRHGEVHRIAKRVGIKTNVVRDRLGDEVALPSVADAKAEEAEEAARQREALRARQQAERAAFPEAARLREQAEEHERDKRLRGGLLGLWDRLRGERKRKVELNAQEATELRQRDKTEQEQLTAAQLGQRREMVKEQVEQREANVTTARDLTEDAKVFRNMESDAEAERAARRGAFKERRRTEDRPRRRGRQRDGPTPGR